MTTGVVREAEYLIWRKRDTDEYMWLPRWQEPGEDWYICYISDSVADVQRRYGELVAKLVDSDPINHPAHYTTLAGVECIDVVERFNFNRGNTIKYIWRAGHKGNELEDLRKAAWYLNREIERVERER